VGGRTDIFQLLSSEDIDGDKMDFGVTVFAGFRGGTLDLSLYNSRKKIKSL